MSTRAMVFIDGTWLAVTANRLADQYGVQGRTGGPLDFGALPRVCAQEVAAQMALSAGIDVVRTHYFGSIATNFDQQDQDAVQRRSDFFDSLRRHHRYEVFRYETDYRGHRVRRAPGDDGFTPAEKAVDVGLATSLLEMAALSAYDIAIVVCGDRDFVPALQAVRRLGKRVAILSARGSCAREFSDPNDAMRVRDFDTLWLDQLWSQLLAPSARPALRVTGEREAIAVAATVADDSPADDSPYADEQTRSLPAASADRIPTTAEHAVTVETLAAPEHATNTETPHAGAPHAVTPRAAAMSTGVVTKVHAHGYGFVRGDDGCDYYFRRSDFVEGSDFARLERYRTRVAFEVVTPARADQAGRAATMTIVGTTDSPVTVARSAPVRDFTTRDPSWTPPSSPAIGAATGAADLWDDDPFAAPRRRTALAPVSAASHEHSLAASAEPHLERSSETGADESSAAPSPSVTDELSAVPSAESQEATEVPDEATVPEPVTTPKKRRTTRKTLSA